MGKTNRGIIFNIKRFSVHDGPGIRTSIFLKGCPLKCIWCHNPEGIDPDIAIWYRPDLCISCGRCAQSCPDNALLMINQNGKYVEINKNLCTLNGNCVKACPTGAMDFTGSIVTVEDIMNEIRKDVVFYLASGGGVTLSGGEPLHQKDFCFAILKACKNEKINTAIETSLFCDKEILDDLIEFIDHFLIDIKIIDPVIHLRFTGQPNNKIKENLRFLSTTGKDIIIRVPLVKGITDTKKNIEEIEKFLKEFKLDRPIEYLPFNPLTRSKYQRLSVPFLLDP